MTAVQKYRRNKRPSQLWYTPEQYAIVQAAARLTRRSLVNFATMAAVDAARRLIQESKRD